MKYSNILAITMSTALIAACGGGGGGNSTTVTAAPTATAALNSSNQNVVAQEVASTAFSATSSISTLTGAESTNENTLLNFAFSQLDSVDNYLVNAKNNAILVGAMIEQTSNCAASGTTAISVSDTDNSHTLSSGDTATFNFNNCNDGANTINGTFTLVVNNMVGTYGSNAYTSNATLTFNTLTSTSGVANIVLNGPTSLIENVTGANSRTSTVSTPSLTMTATYAGVARSRTLGAYSATKTKAPNTTYGYTTSYSASGTVASSALSSQMVSFRTSTPFIALPGDTYPSSGVMIISGAAGSQIKLTALSASQVKEELDANGDGTYESNSTVAWNTLQ